jgi:hypothetical protein
MNYAPHIHVLAVQWGFMYCLGIFSITMTGTPGIHKTTSMKPSFVAQKEVLD